MANPGESPLQRGAHRFGVIAVAVAVVLIAAACQDWPQYMGNAALNGDATGATFVSNANVTHLAEAWTEPTGVVPPMVAFGAPIPVVAGSHLFAATPDGRLISGSTDGATGCSGAPVTCQPRWTATVAGFARTTTPAVSGSVVYEDFTSTTTQTGVLAAFDANGVTNCSGTPLVCQPLWTASLTTFLGVTVSGGLVYADDIPTRQLEAFDATGTTNCSGTPKVCQPLWTAAVGAFGIPSVSNGHVYVASTIQGAPWVAVYDAKGVTDCSGAPTICQPLWTVALPQSTSASVDVSNGVGYVETDAGFGGSPSSELVAFDATGATNCSGSPTVCQPLWTARLTAPEETNTPAVAGGRVYAASAGGWGALDVFDAAGVTNCSGTPVTCTPLSTITPENAQFNQGSPIVVNGLVYEAGRFYDAASVAGCSASAPVVCNPLWTAGSTYKGNDYVFAAIDKDTLFVGETDGAIHAFKILSS